MKKICRSGKMLSAEMGSSLRVVMNSEIRTILPHNIRKPNSVTVFSFIQNFSKFLTNYTFFKTLAYFLARFGDTDRCFLLADTPQKQTTSSIYQYVLRILEFLPFNFSQKFYYFV